MHILVITNIEWSDENAFGNTISNWFEGTENIRFSCIYQRNDLPNNNVCHRYYRITPFSILRNFFSKEKIGIEFSYNKSKEKTLAKQKSKER